MQADLSAKTGPGLDGEVAAEVAEEEPRQGQANAVAGQRRAAMLSACSKVAVTAVGRVHEFPHVLELCLGDTSTLIAYAQGHSPRP